MFLSTSRLESTPIAATSTAVSATPPTCSRGKMRHGISSAYRLTPHVSAIGAERSDQTGERSEHAVLEQQHLRNRPRVGAERLEHRRLVHALELRHRHGADQNQPAAEKHQAADDGDRQRDLLHDVADRLEHVMEIDDRHVRETARRARAATARGPPGPSGPFSGATKVLRRLSSAPGRNTNMKPPFRESRHSTSRMLVTRASIARPRMSNRIVSPTLIREPLVDALLHRHLGSGDGPFQNRAGDQALVRLEMVAVRDRELALQPEPPLPDILHAVQLRLLPAHADDARAQHRDELRRGSRRSPGRPETRVTPSTCVVWMSSRNMSGESAAACTENSSSRLACSERTPTMKKAPRPTASRITRV